ncbi:hypothetical protein [Desulfovibrio ferrophilus]|uniref:Threonyl/alanyl tRNA synthetase SAD n=1 Tax=Desulfovibrio ferrophilus TaxID=241368 RepID=A0A2Z6AWZ4_9BACT|nr:hypothetical protein [Desulfovibrio ferrophilus]BBD07740.1 threonyl/alanyl tRNA synthetase SAD [Desulfovibrio ferrophilus]
MSKPSYPRMHTAEHILNQTMVRVLESDRCFSAHINSKKSKCDYHFDRTMTDEEAVEVEMRVNDVLASGLAVIEEMMPVNQAAELFNLSRLPDPDVDVVRIVHVGEYDACPCIGEHVSNTAEIGAFRLVSHSWEEGVLRLRFKLSAPV